jgi:UDP-N-acetylglucosamine--N-acetylmuramyl-(pentapeptide) pyrophosphoryl-undecaprenol N-acetylglucosamine transferase
MMTVKWQMKKKVRTSESKYLFAAGGSWGHIGPAIAVADQLKKIDSQGEITFVGSKSKLESAISIPYPVRKILKAPLPRKFSINSLLFPFKFLIALFQSIFLVRKTGVVIGFGGYVSTPIYLAAKLLNKPLIIHEANALPGFANRLGRKFATKIFTNFEGLAAQWRGVFVGIPLSASVKELAERIRSAMEVESRGGGNQSSARSDKKILVLGGSQGSARINNTLWDFLATLPADISILHAIGAGAREPIGQRLGAFDISRYQKVSFIEDMASAYESADLVISRAGAVTCAEIRELGKSAIIVPLSHGNGEQQINAEELEKSGQVIVVKDEDFTPGWLVANLARALKLPHSLPEKPMLEASKIIADEIYFQGNLLNRAKNLPKDATNL